MEDDRITLQENDTQHDVSFKNEEDNNSFEISEEAKEQSNKFFKFGSKPKKEKRKFESFGFKVISIDGNNIEQIIDAFNEAKVTKGVPTAIIAKTIKGKGVSFMEDNASWHGKAPNAEQLKEALECIQSKT